MDIAFEFLAESGGWINLDLSTYYLSAF